MDERFTTMKIEIAKIAEENARKLYEHQDKITLQILPLDTLNNLKERIELELLRREKGEESVEYIEKYYEWELKRREQGAKLDL
jgi:hypothetical protein